MKYTQYLQDGGAALGSDIQEQVIALVQAAMGGNQEALNQIQEIQKSAESGNQQAAQIMQMIQAVAELMQGQAQQGQAAAMKCGGKAKKMQIGGKEPVTFTKSNSTSSSSVTYGEKGAKVHKGKKGLCSCMLKKQGGRLIEVDSCTGLPIHKEGGSIRKFLPGGAVVNPRSSVAKFFPEKVKYDFTLNGSSGHYDNRWGVQNGKNYFYYDATGLGGRYYYVNNGQLYSYADNSWNGGTFDPSKGTLVKDAGQSFEGMNTDPAMKAWFDLYWKRSTTPSESVSTSADQSVAQTQPRTSYNGISREEALRRLNLMLAAQANGFQANLVGKNNGADGIWGNSSADAWDRYNTWAANYGNDLTNLLLLDYNPNAEGALALGADAAARRARLQAAQEKANTDALTFNGTTYEDDEQYNAAVKAYNEQQHQAYIDQRIKNGEDYNLKRQLATGYAGITNGILERRNRAFDNLSALQNKTLDYSQLSARDIRDMLRQIKRGQRMGLYSGNNASAYYTNTNNTLTKPTEVAGYTAPQGLTDELKNATTFKRGGKTLELFQKGGKNSETDKLIEALDKYIQGKPMNAYEREPLYEDSPSLIPGVEYPDITSPWRRVQRVRGVLENLGIKAIPEHFKYLADLRELADGLNRYGLSGAIATGGRKLGLWKNGGKINYANYLGK